MSDEVHVYSGLGEIQWNTLNLEPLGHVYDCKIDDDNDIIW